MRILTSITQYPIGAEFTIGQSKMSLCYVGTTLSGFYFNLINDRGFSLHEQGTEYLPNSDSVAAVNLAHFLKMNKLTASYGGEAVMSDGTTFACKDVAVGFGTKVKATHPQGKITNAVIVAVAYDTVLLVNPNTGTRFADPVKVANIQDLTDEEFKKLASPSYQLEIA